ncbi:glycerophosphoryl diester phosphodiesterase family protein [Haematococcus lacustris]
MLSCSQAQKAPWSERTRPYVIGHRGACAYFPDHSAASYLMAIEQGADFIECDIVLTKDLVPVCRHEPWLSGTTNAMALFPDKVATYMVDGENVTDIFSVDLTLAEVRSLRAKQPLPALRPTMYDGHFQVVTLEEYLQIALNAPRTVGIYPENKHPTFHNRRPEVLAANTTIQDIMLNMLVKYGYTGPMNSPAWRRQPVFIQSFEQNDLVDLKSKTCIPLIQLLDSPGFVTPDRNKEYNAMVSDESLDDIATYATGVGPWKNMLAAPAANGSVVSTGLVARLHARGLSVHLYTLRPEAMYIFPQFNSQTTFNEFSYWFRNEGVEGGFTDSPVHLKAFFDAEAIDGNGWSLNQRQRMNSVPVCHLS